MKYYKYLAVFSLSTLLISFSKSSPAVEFSLYGDVQYQSSELEDTFVLGPFHIIADQEISDTTLITLDLAFEEHEHAFETHLERFYLKKSFSDHFNFTVGRFQKTLGLWRHNFHHGSLSQDTITRPFFLESEEIEEGIFPAHLIGLLFGYESQKTTFQLAASNSSGMDTETVVNPDDTAYMESLNTSDPSSGKTLVTRFTYRIVEPLELGFFAMRNDVVEIGEDHDFTMVEHGETLFEQQVLGFDASWFIKKFYAFGEFYQLTIDDNQETNPAFPYSPNSDSYKAIAYYLQLGYRITNKFTLALRRESLDFDSGSSTFFDIQGIVPETRNVLALNYHIEESNVLRFEARQEERENQDTETFYGLQWFFYLL
jgi:hypothetical protein